MELAIKIKNDDKLDAIRYVNFDSWRFAEKNILLMTSGLANCIAIVAYYKTTGAYILGHYDTAKALEFSEEHNFSQSTFANLKDYLIDKLRIKIGKGFDARNVTFHFCLGIIWYDNSNTRYSKLINIIHDVFDVAKPDKGKTARFSPISKMHVNDNYIEVKDRKDSDKDDKYSEEKFDYQSIRDGKTETKQCRI